MALTDPMLLPSDVVFVPVGELPTDVREKMQADDTDFAVTRPGMRNPSSIVDAQSVELLREFREARTIVDAVIRYSRTHKRDPERTLEEAYPMIGRLVDSQVLVPADSDQAERIQPSLKADARVGDAEVIECVQVLQDTELYRCRIGESLAALKILRPGCGKAFELLLDREAAILTRLDGEAGAKLLASDRFEDRRYLLIEWCPGMDASSAAADLRRLQNSGSRQLLELCCSILDAYAGLHARGVVHSDIHPRNILVSGENTVRIIDYGVSRMDGLPDALAHPHRAGVGFFLEPEHAHAVRASHHPPRSCVAGEQYALAVLVYSLLTGNYPQRFSLEKEEMLRQIEQDPPVPFDRQEAQRWPNVEGILARALSKNPAARFESIAAFAAALRETLSETPEAVVRDTSSTSDSIADSVSDSVRGEYLSKMLDRIRHDGPLSSGLTDAPTASVAYGAAGLAYALYRLACMRSDPALLAAADVWISRAALDINKDEAFYNSALEMPLEVVGRVAPLHALPGIYCVQALVSHAMGDLASQQAAIDSFAAASKAPCENLDATLGRCGTLLASSMMVETIPGQTQLDVTRLRDLGDEVMRGLWEQLDAYAPIAECPEIRYSGAAHGWAGMLYATIRWSRSTGQKPPASVEPRLEQLAELAEPVGRGARWPWVIPPKGNRIQVTYMPGWCNGSAGLVYLWTLAHEVFRHEIYLALARKAAWNAWETPGAAANLCCGLAGQAYGVLNLFKHTGESEWLRRASELANRAVVISRDPYAQRPTAPDGVPLRDESLYKGGLGVAVLTADLASPRNACMPFFESEGQICLPL